jgi:hypothetical protein
VALASGTGRVAARLLALGSAMSRRRRDRWDRREREVEEITPQTGSLGIQGQATSPHVEGPAAITPLGMSQQTRAYIIACEEPDCPWSSAEVASPGIAELRLLDHARAAHAGIRADTISAKIRSRRWHWKIEQVDL